MSDGSMVSAPAEPRPKIVGARHSCFARRHAAPRADGGSTASVAGNSASSHGKPDCLDARTSGSTRLRCGSSPRNRAS
eukprot:scaffold18771_cov129-Isochrysis_galbana.AAC.3